MNGVKFIKQNGGLGRILAGETHISGLIVYGEPNFPLKLVTSVKQSEDLGLTHTGNPVLHYHISEFFRINEGAKLYIRSVTVSDGNYTEVKVMQNFAQGSIRQFAICDFKTSVNSIPSSLVILQQTADDFWIANTPVNFLLSMKVTSVDIANLPDLHTLKAENVSVVLGQDGNGRGYFLNTTNPSISCIGTVLGTVSKAQIHESIAWVEKQNLVTGIYDKELTGRMPGKELDMPALCDGSKIGSYTNGQLQQLNSKGYLFGIKHTGITGTYLNDSFTATALDSDFMHIENVRVINEAVRNVNKVLVPKISSPMYIDATTGLIDTTSLSALEALCDEALEKMIRKGNISGFKVTINPNQNLLSSSKLEIFLKIVPVGTLREIEVKIGLTLKNN